MTTASAAGAAPSAVRQVWVRDAAGVQRVYALLWLALLPALLWSCYYTGVQTLAELGRHNLAPETGWRRSLTEWLAGFDSHAVWDCWVYGLLLVIPATVVATLAGWGVARLAGARVRRPLHPAFAFYTLLFALLCPPALPLWQVALWSAALVVVDHLVADARHWRLQPAALILLLTWLTVRLTGWTPPVGDALAVAAAGGRNALTDAGSWWQALSGGMPGGAGAAALPALLLGAGLLLSAGLLRRRPALGSLLALLLALWCGRHFSPHGSVTAVGMLPGYWQLLLGGTLPVLLLLAGDPRHVADTRAGLWWFGVGAGVVTALLRLYTPLAAESVFIGVLAGNLCGALADRASLNAYLRRRTEPGV